tara:strand:+ start:131 stop:406 length:276 start_codon:yes stop_codon:yes gene_type:complete
LSQTLSPSLAAYIQPGEAEATAHALLLGKYSLSLGVEMPAFNGILKLSEMVIINFITLSDQEIMVSNQWGVENIGNFIEHCKKNEIKIGKS